MRRVTHGKTGLGAFRRSFENGKDQKRHFSFLRGGDLPDFADHGGGLRRERRREQPPLYLPDDGLAALGARRRRARFQAQILLFAASCLYSPSPRRCAFGQRLLSFLQNFPVRLLHACFCGLSADDIFAHSPLPQARRNRRGRLERQALRPFERLYPFFCVRWGRRVFGNLRNLSPTCSSSRRRRAR